MLEKIVVLGLGKVGTLVAGLLYETGFNVTAIDERPREGLPFSTKVEDITQKESLATILEQHDAVVSCLPYFLNKNIARHAAEQGTHYFDLTEDVDTTGYIMGLAESASTVLAPQCGLAPGYIGIVGADLAKDFEKIRHIKLRVGALPQHPTGLLGYAFNWSPEGVINEYLKDSEVIENGERKQVSSLEWLETIFIQGQELEAFTTSGGLGTMCETYLNKAENLDYKSMRYPGHAKLMNFLLHEMLLREDPALAVKLLSHAKPPVDQDVVYVHASVEGMRGGKSARAEFVESYYPKDINGQNWRAISWTTAASVCAVIELVNAGKLPQKGFIRQEEIPLVDFFKTRTGGLYKKEWMRERV